MGGVDRRTFLAWLGSTAVGTGAVGWLSSGSAAAAERATVDAGLTVLTGATLIDGTGAPPVPSATVVLAGERILAVGRNRDVPAIAGVRVVDLAGKYVVPGLWDVHTHSSEIATTFPPMHLVYGVTGIREMRGSAETHDVWARIQRGELDGPSMVIASKVLDGPDSRNPFSVPIVTEEDARQAMAEAKADGADLVKVYSFMDRQTHAVIAREADRVGLRIAGHSPSPIPVQDAIDVGQLSIEHNYGMHLSTSADRDEYFAQLEQMPDDADDPNWWGWQASTLEREAFRTYRPEFAAELAGRLTERGAWHVPTLAVESSISRHPSKHLENPELVELMERFMPRSLREEWVTWIGAWPPWTPEREAMELAYFDAKLQLVGDIAAAGGNTGTGTDTGVAFVFPGLATHDELELLVRAGMSPMRALQAATRDAARCAEQEHVAGTVTAGKRADLLVLDADPLADIRNSRQIHAVVARGRYLGPAQRQEIFDELEQAAQES
ncbi:amidohydrolase family protein [Jiangella asiatica]|uniref:Amidohydrolase n=1 Tax=Jiangella asiatica TaxID=2530372 RepID=A0A4R5DQL5_9ACTN|nr:amidohydrolase family protein [Jiangella asiatica]TDE14341.1 amidohydrolase [Jiangella asiatica]